MVLDSNKVKRVQKSAKKHKSKDIIKDLTKRKYSGENIDQLRKKLNKEKDRTQENLQKIFFLSRSRVNKESSSLVSMVMLVCGPQKFGLILQVFAALKSFLIYL